MAGAWSTLLTTDRVCLCVPACSYPVHVPISVSDMALTCVCVCVRGGGCEHTVCVHSCSVKGSDNHEEWDVLL